MEPQKIIEQANKEGGRYHKISFPDGTVLNGIYDMSKCLKYYNIPDNLSGKTVLEIGTADGYFATELYKRSASKVVAIDFNTSQFHQAVNDLMNTKVEFMAKNLFDLDESFEKFDLVFCSHVLQHLSDPFTALRKIKLVTKQQAIICTTYLDNYPQFENLPILFFIGEEKIAKRGTYWTYHRMNRACLRKMLEKAKFKNVEEISKFYSISEDGAWKIPSVVFHCNV